MNSYGEIVNETLGGWEVGEAGRQRGRRGELTNVNSCFLFFILQLSVTLSTLTR